MNRLIIIGKHMEESKGIELVLGKKKKGIKKIA